MDCKFKKCYLENTFKKFSTNFPIVWTKEKIIEMRRNSELIFKDCTEDNCLNESEQKNIRRENLTLAKPFFQLNTTTPYQPNGYTTENSNTVDCNI